MTASVELTRRRDDGSARLRRSPRSTSRSDRARSSPCSGRAAAARRPCCGWSPASCEPIAGRVTVDGVQPAGGPRRKAHRLRPPAPALLPWRTVAARRRAAARRPPAVARRRPSDPASSSTVGLAPFDDAYPHELSGGCSSASRSPCLGARRAVLLLDEPFAALDEITRVAAPPAHGSGAARLDGAARHPLDRRGGVPVRPGGRAVRPSRDASSGSRKIHLPRPRHARVGGRPGLLRRRDAVLRALLHEGAGR